MFSCSSCSSLPCPYVLSHTLVPTPCSRPSWGGKQCMWVCWWGSDKTYINCVYVCERDGERKAWEEQWKRSEGTLGSTIVPPDNSGFQLPSNLISIYSLYRQGMSQPHKHTNNVSRLTCPNPQKYTCRKHTKHTHNLILYLWLFYQICLYGLFHVKALPVVDNSLKGFTLDEYSFLNFNVSSLKRTKNHIIIAIAKMSIRVEVKEAWKLSKTE